ncbi:ring-cleaving dioxygenase [Carnobacterium funditum]|uniref:ring-cleaving dioxygenase n=1 Tax=Carnobacterium funditum TaxID=2752 RepID=UPI00055043DC|nr:ring-cleaving dioxygenase [Carnobacterium funditum]
MNELKPFKGIHHVTAITSSAEKIYKFFTYNLGLRLVKKNVNQDDLSTYHLFFADDRGNPGTDMTFFDFSGIAAHQQGTNDISRTSFRVASDDALSYWEKRLTHYEIKHDQMIEQFGKQVLYFEDFDKQQYAIFSDEKNVGIASGEPWHKGPVPDEYAITGLGPIFLRVQSEEMMDQALVQVMKMRKIAREDNFTLYEMGEGGNGASVIVEKEDTLESARQGYGGVHHVAFRVEDKEQLDAWVRHFKQLGLQNSGLVDRFYFKAVYTRLYPNILFELSTEGPGFIDDEEAYEVLGETLTLPPHLRDKREYVESQLPDFDTVRSTKKFKKEYFE